MLIKQIKNLLPKRLADGVALKTLISQHQLSWFRGFRKLHRFSKLTRLLSGGVLLFYLSAYQPTLVIPPFTQSFARAEFSQSEIIKPGSFSQAFYLPHPGYLTTKFSSWHPGIDIATGRGMPIHPISSGKVIETSLGWWGLGHYTVVEHEEGFQSTYAHMGRIFAKKGDVVNPTSILGEVGLTGRTTGPHTHLEVTKDGQPFDPLMILPPISNWPDNSGKAPHGQGGFVVSPTPTPIKADKPSSKINLINLQNPGQTKPEVRSPLLPALPLDRI